MTDTGTATGGSVPRWRELCTGRGSRGIVEGICCTQAAGETGALKGGPTRPGRSARGTEPLPGLVGPLVLLEAIRAGVSQLVWQEDGFAYAESYDEERKRYRGLRCGQQISLTEDDTGLLVKPEAAVAQVEPPGPGRETVPPGADETLETDDTAQVDQPRGEPPTKQPKRYHGTATLDPMRVGRDASQIADEVITHLVGLVGADLRVTLEIEADIPGGVPDNVVRIVTENGRTLRFDSHGFEVE